MSEKAGDSYLGPLRVRCIDFEVSEEMDRQIANFELTFVAAGEEPRPSSFINTAPSVLTIGIAIIGAPSALLSSFTSWLTGLVGSLTALPRGVDPQSGVAVAWHRRHADSSRRDGRAILDVTGAYSQAIVDGAVSVQGDPSGGLADLAN